MNLQARAAFPPGQPIGSPLPNAESQPQPQPEHDSFSDALLFIAAHHGRAITRDALLSGLPIEHDQLTPNLFARAAIRAGLEVEATKRELADIPSLVLPAVLIFHDRTTRILMTTDGETIEIVNPSTRKRERLLIREMERDYLGYAFLLRPATMTTDRVAAAGGSVRSGQLSRTATDAGGGAFLSSTLLRKVTLSIPGYSLTDAVYASEISPKPLCYVDFRDVLFTGGWAWRCQQ